MLFGSGRCHEVPGCWMCTVKEAQDRQLEWMGMHEDDKIGKRENDEKRWWTKMHKLMLPWA